MFLFNFFFHKPMKCLKCSMANRLKTLLNFVKSCHILIFLKNFNYYPQFHLKYSYLHNQKKNICKT
jgi:hypothetical protein